LLEDDENADTSVAREFVFNPSAESLPVGSMLNNHEAELNSGLPSQENKSSQSETLESRFDPFAVGPDESIGKQGTVQSVKAWVSNSIGNLVGSGPSKKLTSALSPRAGGEPITHELRRGLANCSFQSIATIPSGSSICFEDDEQDVSEKAQDDLAPISKGRVQAEAALTNDDPLGETEEQAFECVLAEPKGHGVTGEEQLEHQSTHGRDVATLRSSPETKTCASAPVDLKVAIKEDDLALVNSDDRKDVGLSSSTDAALSHASEAVQVILVPPTQTVSEKDFVATSPPRAPMAASLGTSTGLQHSLEMSEDLAEDSAALIEMTVEETGASSSEKALLQPSELTS